MFGKETVNIVTVIANFVHISTLASQVTNITLKFDFGIAFIAFVVQIGYLLIGFLQ